MSCLRIATAGLALLLLTCPPSAGHDVKVLVSQYTVDEPGGRATVYLSWGHRLPVDDFIDASSLGRYELLRPDGKAVPLEASGLSLQANAVEFEGAGLYQAVVTRKPSVYTYVFDADGVRQLRRGPKTAVTEGKVDVATRSQQCGKALIAVGPPAGGTFAPVGQPIEIVPLDPPSGWKQNGTLRFRVLLEGRPLPFADVTARYVGFKPDDAWNYATTSDREGEFTVRPEQPGIWVLRVNTKRLARGEARKEYDQESFTATLSLEVAP